jgi:hypothetical protein
MRYALLAIPFLPIMWSAANFVVPVLRISHASEIAKAVAQQLHNKEVREFDVLQIMRKNDLAWCYYCSEQGKLLPVTRAFAPPLKEFDNQSREVVIGDVHYYDAVTKLGDGNYLHVGIRGSADNLLDIGSWSVIGASLVVYLASVVLIELIVVQPILRSSRLVSSSQESGELDRAVLEKEKASWLLPVEASALIDCWD